MRGSSGARSARGDRPVADVGAPWFTQASVDTERARQLHAGFEPIAGSVYFAADLLGRFVHVQPAPKGSKAAPGGADPPSSRDDVPGLGRTDE